MRDFFIVVLVFYMAYVTCVLLFHGLVAMAAATLHAAGFLGDMVFRVSQ
jgi:hypothetical protein